MSDIYSSLKVFFEENKLSKHAAHSIRNGREIAVHVEESKYTFAKEKDNIVFKNSSPLNPDLTFTIPAATAQQLCAQNFDNVAQVGLFIFEKMLAHDEKEKIHAHVHAGFLSLMTGGYLGVLASGGVDIAKFLATKGLGNPGKIKDAINRMRKG